MIDFHKKIVMLGYGSVAQCVLPILVKHLRVPLRNITIVDFENQHEILAPWIEQGVRFICLRITEDNLEWFMNELLAPGDLLIDLAWNIDSCELLQRCRTCGVFYINTSVEVWNPDTETSNGNLAKRTLYWRHMNIRRTVEAWKNTGPTAVIEHGANPGLISHWTKQGLVDIGEKLLEDRKADPAEADEIRHYIDNRNFGRLAMKLGVKVIHISERDTQITDCPKRVDEFVNTWSIEGFREEGTTTVELGWGTHEKELPLLAYKHDEGPKNQIFLARMGINTWISSWVPHYSIRGMAIRHGEAFTMSDHLTVWEDGYPVYRPTVYYVYCPSDSAIASLNELRGNDYRMQTKMRIMRDEIVEGSDILGSLLMGHAYKSWWTGCNLNIEEARRSVPHQNATTMQVAISVVAAAMWIVENPNRGVCVPDDLPYDYILNIARPYLGQSISMPFDWTPLDRHANHFNGFNYSDIDLNDPWQFKNFLLDFGE
ncbi:MAG: homospermidine synthase [Pirellulales bacterium]|nr:homospermidine synthase [Pirellulales bacterium]